MGRPSLERAGSLLLAVVATALTLLVAELVLRATLLPVARPYPMAPGLVVPDPAIGFRLRPDHRSVMTNGHFRVTVETDARGLRDLYDPSLPEVGLVAIGDSQTFGHGVEAEDTWVEQLQTRLGANVVNAGVFGYAPSQYEHVLRRLRAAGQPIRRVLYALSWNDVAFGATAPDAQVAVDGLLVRNPAYATASAREHGWRARLIGSRPVQRLVRHTALGQLGRAAGNSLLGRLGLAAYPNYVRLLDANAAELRARLGEIDELLRAWEARLVVVHIANPNLAMPDLWEDHRRRYAFPRFYAEAQLAPWCRARGIAFADATRDLEARYLASGGERTSLILPVDDHYNRSGQAVIAAVFARTLE